MGREDTGRSALTRRDYVTYGAAAYPEIPEAERLFDRDRVADVASA